MSGSDILNRRQILLRRGRNYFAWSRPCGKLANKKPGDAVLGRLEAFGAGKLILEIKQETPRE